MSDGTGTLETATSLPPRGARPAWLGPRALLGQALVLAILIGFLGYIASNVVANVARLNIHTGFAFLDRPAGMEIIQHLIPFTDRSGYLAAFWVALLNTVVLAVVAMLIATPLGFLAGLARLSSNRLLRGVAAGYVDIVRNVPLLLQILYWYFAVLSPLPAPRQSLSLFGLFFINKRGLYVPMPVAEPGAGWLAVACVGGLAIWLALGFAARPRRFATGRPSRFRLLRLLLGLALPALVIALEGFPVAWDVPALTGFNFRGGLVVLPEFVAMALALAIYNGAYIAEHVRGGIQSVPRGQAEAGLALGLSRFRVATKIVLPQAMRAIVPPLGGQYIQLLKASSLGAAIAYPELMLVFAGNALNQTGQPLEIMMITLGTYLLLCLGISAVANAVNRRVQLVER